MKFTNEIAVITAVSDLKIFFDIVKDFTSGTVKIDSRSAGEKSPSGPIKILKASSFLILSFFKIDVIWKIILVF